MLVEEVEAILLVSPDAAKLKEFYSSCLELPLEDEVHEGVPLHYTCKVGSVHFAIHPSDGWPGVPTLDSQSPMIAFRTHDLEKVASKLKALGVDIQGPTDHGFADVVSFRDPDGNHIELIQPQGKA